MTDQNLSLTTLRDDVTTGVACWLGDSVATVGVPIFLSFARGTIDTARLQGLLVKAA
ncbi:MAG: hypothetical protein GDA36_00325 [Rhodobacteraceae bacterium]|nr:hypothetical protein [Paracoccaceae bacterium]